MTSGFSPASFGGGDRAATLDYELPPVRARRFRHWISVLMGVLIFLAGSICGAATMRMAVDYYRPRPVPSADLAVNIGGLMQRELELTADQRASIEEVVRLHQPRLHQIRLETIPAMRRELLQTIDEMSAVLTPDQAARWRAAIRGRLDAFYPVNEAASPEATPPE